MRSTVFWTFFDDEAAPKLKLRSDTFRRVFEYMDTLAHPITMVETGCVRTADNWDGDGLSTVLFDRYLTARADGSVCWSVDINPRAVANARSLVGPQVTVVEDDSVRFLSGLTRRLCSAGRTLDFAYLDAFDLDTVYWQPSAIHHLKELMAIMRCLRPDTLVVVDDCASQLEIVQGAGSVDNDVVQVLSPPSIGGKGRLIAQYAHAVGAHLEFSYYQAGWTQLVAPLEEGGSGRRAE